VDVIGKVSALNFTASFSSPVSTVELSAYSRLEKEMFTLVCEAPLTTETRAGSMSPVEGFRMVQLLMIRLPLVTIAGFAVEKLVICDELMVIELPAELLESMTDSEEMLELERKELLMVRLTGLVLPRT
jgi:hypothetical protein